MSFKSPAQAFRFRLIRENGCRLDCATAASHRHRGSPFRITKSEKIGVGTIPVCLHRASRQWAKQSPAEYRRERSAVGMQTEPLPKPNAGEPIEPIRSGAIHRDRQQPVALMLAIRGVAVGGNTNCTRKTETLDPLRGPRPRHSRVACASAALAPLSRHPIRMSDGEPRLIHIAADPNGLTVGKS